MKMFSGLFIGFLVLLAWVMIATSGEERISRACKPIVWTGNLFESVFMIAREDWADNVKSVFDNVDYTCRFSVWRFFYEEEYVRQIDAERENNQQQMIIEEGNEGIVGGGVYE